MKKSGRSQPCPVDFFFHAATRQNYEPLLINPSEFRIGLLSLSYADPLKTVSEEWRAGLVILYALATALSIGGNAVVIFVLTFSKR